MISTQVQLLVQCSDMAIGKFFRVSKHLVTRRDGCSLCEGDCTYHYQEAKNNKLAYHKNILLTDSTAR